MNSFGGFGTNRNKTKQSTKSVLISCVYFLFLCCDREAEDFQFADIDLLPPPALYADSQWDHRHVCCTYYLKLYIRDNIRSFSHEKHQWEIFLHSSEQFRCCSGGGLYCKSITSGFNHWKKSNETEKDFMSFTSSEKTVNSCIMMPINLQVLLWTSKMLDRSR